MSVRYVPRLAALTDLPVRARCVGRGQGFSPTSGGVERNPSGSKLRKTQSQCLARRLLRASLGNGEGAPVHVL